MKKKNQQDLTFSKRLTIVDTISWILLMIGLIIVVILNPQIATYCVNLCTTITAAYVSLRLGYTGKAALQNYKKINNTINQLTEDQQEGNG